MAISNYEYILGIQCYASHDAGAALVRFSRSTGEMDYVAISEERLIRKKHPYSFPFHSINYCMEQFDLDKLSQIDLLVTDFIRLDRWHSSGPSFFATNFDYLKIKFDIDPAKIVSTSHHMAHAASAFYTSGFEDAAVLVVDGNGSELQTNSFLRGNSNGLEYVDTYKAHGIGSVYTGISSWVLNMGTGGEGKTMGLAPFGEKFEPVLDIAGELDGIKTDFSSFMRRMPYSDALNHLPPFDRINPLKHDLKTCPDQEALLDPYFARVAFEVQEETERTMVHLGQEIERQIDSPNICLSGGVALNSVANKIMFDATKFENIFVFPACSDSGIPLGLALWGYYNAPELGDFERQKTVFKNAYTGRTYANDHISEMLGRHNIPSQEMTPEIVAEHIADGKIIGWFQGGSEYGPRALGNRSILGDSRRAEMKDIINHRVKHRESFRPFAPAILAEQCSEYFDLEDDSPYMLLVAEVKKPDVIPSVTHVDGTARVQTVTLENNYIFYKLISAFNDLTGVPVILNTSFNDAGEPIVETPEDAMICFLKTEMDYLVLGDYLVDARDVDVAAVIETLSSEREKTIGQRSTSLMERFFPGFDEDECSNFVGELNKISSWHAQFRSKYELEKRVMHWKEKKSKILIVGTRDHTAFLQTHINEFSDVDVVGFIDYNGQPDQDGDIECPYPEINWEQAASLNYVEILVSSFEFAFDISALIKQRAIEMPVYEIYDDMSRSLQEALKNFPSFKIAPNS
jgi:carbamoyltransferase